MTKHVLKNTRLLIYRGNDLIKKLNGEKKIFIAMNNKSQG